MFASMVWKSLVGSRGRSLLALAAVLVPAALVTATSNFALDAESKMTVELRRQGPNVILEVKRGVAAMDPAEVESALRRFPSVLSKQLDGCGHGLDCLGDVLPGMGGGGHSAKSREVDAV